MGLDSPLFSELCFFCCTSESVCRKRQCLFNWSFTISLKVELFPNADWGLLSWHFFFSVFGGGNESGCFESQECLLFSGITFIDMFPFPLQMAPVLSLSTFHNISTRGWENDEEISRNWLLILCSSQLCPKSLVAREESVHGQLHQMWSKYPLVVPYIYLARSGKEWQENCQINQSPGIVWCYKRGQALELSESGFSIGIH